MAKLLCFGSLNIDKVFSVDSIVKRGETIASTGHAEFPGGKGANQSIALARAVSLDPSTTVHHAGSVGIDGEWLVSLLSSNGIDVSDIVVTDEHSTGCAFIQRDSTGDNAIVLVPGANKQITSAHIQGTMSKFGSTDWLILQNEVNDVPTIIRTGRERGMRIFFNPAPCPNNICDYPLNLVDVLILNESEARTLCTSFEIPSLNQTAEMVLNKIMALLPNLQGVVVTLGSDGVVSAWRADDRKLEISKVAALSNCRVVDTTGAGDTFVGFFIAALVHENVGTALSIAVTASGMACESEGAAPSIPSMEAVLSRMKELCPYCNFPKLRQSLDKVAKEAANDGLTAAILEDLHTTFESLNGADRVVTSIHFGGGTPSLMPPKAIERITSSVKSHITVSPNLEVALEANPSSMSRTSLELYRNAGINRLSIGIQSFKDNHLKFLGRDHSSKDAVKVLKEAHDVFSRESDTVSCDLMFGIPGQTVEELMDDLNTVINTVGVERLKHLSLYQLTFEPGTPLWKNTRKSNIDLTNTPDAVANMYEAGLKFLETRTNLRQYEVSNYAVPGHESIHNRSYWRGWDFIGVGPGAHGRYTDFGKKSRVRTRKIADLKLYVEQCRSSLRHGTKTLEVLDRLSAMKEMVVLGMRTKEGISLTPPTTLGLECNLSEIIDWKAVETLHALGFLNYRQEEQRLCPSNRGLSVLDAILGEIFL